MRILLIAWGVPYPTSGGGRQRTNLLYRSLSQLGRVDLLALNDPRQFKQEEIRHLIDEFGLIGMMPMTPPGDLWPWCLVKPFAPRWINRIAHNLDPSWSYFGTDHRLIQRLNGILNLEEYDLIVGRYARALAKLGIPNMKTPNVILDVDDLDTDIYESRYRQNSRNYLKRIILKRHIPNVRLKQTKYLAQLTHFWVANPDNLAESALAGATHLPNIPFDSERIGCTSIPVGNLNLMTIGSFGHRPNVEGVDWFLSNVWPLICLSIPGCRFSIYGSQLSDSCRIRWSKITGVKVIGYVENVSSAYADSALAVCPVLCGAGTNIKVIEAGRYGRQCILTEAASRGYINDRDLRPVLKIGRSVSGLADQIVKVLSNPIQNQLDAIRFRVIVEKNYCFDKFSRIVHESVLKSLKN